MRVNLPENLLKNKTNLHHSGLPSEAALSISAL